MCKRGFAEVTDLEEQPSVATAASAPVRKKHWLAAPGTTRPVRDVPMIDSNDLDAFDKVSQMRIDGTPCILVGATGWAGFTEPWQRAGGGGSQELDVDRFCSQLGDADVPVVERNHDFNQPLSRTMKLRDFVHEAWQRDSPGLYLHQWQFPASPALARALTSQPGAHVHSPALGVDLLDHCRHSGKGSGSSGGGGGGGGSGGRADVQQQQLHALPNPLQYLFMGAASTRTRLHFDDGGLAITIMPIVGKKECWLVHRDDGDKVANGEVDVRAPDLHRFPRFAAARVWHAVLNPGQVLVMPHGTWHACRNATPCLSYTRLHLDEVNLQAFGDALIRGESPEVCDKRLLWNAAEWLISQVDKATKRAHKQAQAAAARRLSCTDCRTANVQCSHTSSSGQQPQQCITVGGQGGACNGGSHDSGAGGSSSSRSGPADACCCCCGGQHGGSGGAAGKGSGGSAASTCGCRLRDDDGGGGAARAGATGDDESNCSDSTSVSDRETTTRGSSHNLTGQCGSAGARMLATVGGGSTATVTSAASGEKRSGCDDATRSGGSCSRACGSANALLSDSASAVPGRGGTAGRGGGGRKRALMMLHAHNSTPAGSVERMRGRRSGGGGDASSERDGMLKKARKSRQRRRQGISCSGSSDFDGVDGGSSDARARAARQKQRWRSSSAGAAAAARRSPQSSPERRGGGGMDRDTVAAAAPMNAPHGRGDGCAVPHASTSAAAHEKHASAGKPGVQQALASGPAAAAAAKAAVTTAADALLAVSQAESAAEAAAALAAVTAAADVAADAATTAAAAAAACSSAANRAAAAAAEKSAAAAFQTLQYAQALRADAARSDDGSAHLGAASPTSGGGGSAGVRVSSADADAAESESSAETAAGVGSNADWLAAALASASSAAAAAVAAALRIPLPWSVDSDAVRQPAAAAAAAAAAAGADSAADDDDDAGYSGKRAAAAAGAQSDGAGGSCTPAAAAAAAAGGTDIAAAEPDAALVAAAAAARRAAVCTHRRHPRRALQDTGEATRRCVAALIAMRHVARHLHERTSNAASAPAAAAGFRWHELVKDIDSCLNEHARRFRGGGKKFAKKPARPR